MSVITSPTPQQRECTFTEALDLLLSGKKLRHSKMDEGRCVFLHAGYLHVRHADGSLHSLMVGEVDLLATDWTVVREN